MKKLIMKISIIGLIFNGCTSEEDILKENNVQNKKELAYKLSKKTYMGAKSTTITLEYFKNQITEETKEEYIQTEKVLKTVSGRDMFNKIIAERLNKKLTIKEINELIHIEDIPTRVKKMENKIETNAIQFMKVAIANHDKEISVFIEEKLKKLKK